MIKINFLAFRAARKRETIRREISIYFLFLILIFLLMPYTYLTLNSRLSEATNNEKHLREEMKPYRELSRIMAQMKTWKKETTERLKVIEALEKMRMGPVRLLIDIANSVPEHRLWITSLDERGGVLTLSGNAMDNDTVALFMTNLERVDEITSVDLKETRLAEVVRYVDVPKPKVKETTAQEKTEEKRKEKKEKAQSAEVEKKSINYKVTQFLLTCNTGYRIAEPEPAPKKTGKK
jgi:type IV pilus assembly protein PilN